MVSVLVAVGLVMAFSSLLIVSSRPELLHFSWLTFAVNRLLDQYERLSKEEEKAMSEVNEAIARLNRIRAVRAKVKSKGAELFDRGAAEADAEVGVDSSVVVETQQAVGAVQLAGGFGVVDWDAVLSGSEIPLT